MAFAYGLSTSEIVRVSGFGPFDGLWEPSHYCFFGIVLAASGSGLITYSLVWLVLLIRHGQAILPRRRWLLWSLVLVAGTFGVGVGAMVLLSQRAPKLSRNDAESARLQVTVFFILANESPDTGQAGKLTTAEYEQRERSLKQSVKYRAPGCETTSTLFHVSGEITVTGKLTAISKRTEFRMEKDNMVSSRVVITRFDPPQEVGFTARLVKAESNRWLIDELVFQEE